MPHINLHLHCPLLDSFRVQQVAGLFDLELTDTLCEHLTVEVPSVEEPWQIGAIIGPSGSGKTAVARAAFEDLLYTPSHWPEDRAVIDCFGEIPFRQLTQVLGAVGLNSPLAWIKPYAVLSNGEKFRCDLARAVSGGAGQSDQATDGQREEVAKRSLPPSCPSSPGPSVPHCLPPIVFDEFSSVVDRVSACVASATLSRAIRSGRINRRIVAVTCHEDVIAWLAPDWVLDMQSLALHRGRRPRPALRLDIARAPRAAWELFRRHHYLSGQLHRSAQCFVASVDNRPAVFTAVLPFPHPRRPGWREHRTVCLPQYQGIGLGTAMAAYIASLYVATGRPYFSTSSHPAVIQHRMRSPLWRMLRRPAMVSRIGASGVGKTGMSRALSVGRFTAGFEYVGPARRDVARGMGIV